MRHKKLINRRRLLVEQIVAAAALWCIEKVYAMWHVPHKHTKNKIYEFHKLLNVYYTIQGMMGIGQLRWQCYLCHQQNS